MQNHCPVRGTIKQGICFRWCFAGPDKADKVKPSNGLKLFGRPRLHLLRWKAEDIRFWRAPTPDSLLHFRNIEQGKVCGIRKGDHQAHSSTADCLHVCELAYCLVLRLPDSLRFADFQFCITPNHTQSTINNVTVTVTVSVSLSK